MEERDAQKMLDSYIHDYMIKKNMHSAAETFAKEANVNCDKDVVLNAPKGFLTEWWSLFWDVYSAKLESNSNATEGSSSTAAENVTQDVHLNMPRPESAMNFMLPNVGSAVASSGPSTVVSIVGDTTVLRPTMDSFSHNDAPTIRPTREMNLNRSGKTPILDFNFRQGESFTEFLAPRTREQQHLKLPAREVSSSSRLFDVDQLARMLPAIGTSINSPNNVSNHVLPPVRRGGESGSGMRPMDAEPTGEQNAIQIIREPTGISFPFELIGSFHPTIDKLSCCDFSTSGAFFAAGGHAKKVYLWNLRNQSEVTIEGHSQLITDIRFKPDSNFFATSSFDRTVQIFDAANPKGALLNLVGHAANVVSLDFHPKKTTIMCSSDSNDVIRLWRVDQAACFHTFKGANGQIRFQPQLGNLLAAVWRNVINLIDVETGIIQHQFEGHAYDVHSLCWDVEGKCLASVSDDSARIWSIVTGGKCVHQLYSGGNKFASCTFHPAHAQVVLVGSHQAIDIWNPLMGNKLWTYQAHNGVVSALSHASETNVIGSVSHDQYVRLWK